MEVFAGVDCGATNLRVGLVTTSGQLLASSKIPSPLKSHPQNFAQIVQEQLEQMMAEHSGEKWQLQALGVGTPGPLDLEKGWILPSSNLGNTQPIDLRHQFDTVFNIPVYFDRDTDLALLGEAEVGAAVGLQDVVMLTLGTGVGGAIMVNGQIERGAEGRAGEIGHVILNIPSQEAASLPTCGLGHQGCLEALINSAPDLAVLGSYLGYGLADVVDIFNPEMIVIGGGKTKMGDFLPQAVKVMRENVVSGVAEKVKVVYAKLEDLSGVYGGAKLAYDSK